MFAFPEAVILLLVCWFWLQWMFLGFRLEIREFTVRPDVLSREILRCNVAIASCSEEFAIIIVNTRLRSVSAYRRDGV